KDLRAYWNAIATRHGVSLSDVEIAVKAAWGSAVVNYLVQPDDLILKPPDSSAYVCPRCRRQHLHTSGQICTFCQGVLTEPVAPRADEDDYYAYLAKRTGGPFRLHCEELTGQTDRKQAQKRQGRFQDIFLENELELVEAIDLLSVTTTMEAGVDI